MALRIRTLSVRGFRAFGPAEQTLNLPSDIAVVWGPNSKGKTSLAEAFEFLLTGRISRRELMASTQDEFADALRNAHLADSDETSVAACITAADGTDHTLKRVLTTDYGKRQDCASRLTIDDVLATEDELKDLGLILSQPPLEAPVLAQHTLSYVFSVRPQDRANYFKTLLEVTDLDDLQKDIATLADQLSIPNNELVRKFNSCASVHDLAPTLGPMRHTVPELAALRAGIEGAARILAQAAGGPVPASLGEQLAVIRSILADRRSTTFPTQGFEHKDLTSWSPPPAASWNQLTAYLDERTKIDEATRRLVALFNEALKIPTISGITEPVECPLCGSDSALTSNRVGHIRQSVEDAKGFRIAETDALSAVSQLLASVEALAAAAEAAIPQFLRMTASKRHEIGFTIARLGEILEVRAEELIGPWVARVMPLARAMATLRRKARATKVLVKTQTSKLATELSPKALGDAFADLEAIYTALAAEVAAYMAAESQLVTALNTVIDAQADSKGWQSFLDIAQEAEGIRGALIERSAYSIVKEELHTAIRDIDLAKRQVLDDKFSEHSASILAWWERLRPDEPTFFSAVQPRKGAKRTIDFKAGLSANPDRSAPKLRDVIAVFSQSQLHCLGLALFLARAQRENLGFIVLDDPVLSSDEDYRIHFNSTVLSELLAIPMQVIVLTQDHDTWEELELRYRHIGISTSQLYIELPAEGSVIENTSDELLAKVGRAKSLARGGHPDTRKECGIQLRTAGERFCKEMLVRSEHKKGNTGASLTDYDNKTLEWLCPHVDPLLDQDASHSGKLEAFRKTVNDACHDNAPPGSAQMVQACGEIRRFVKDYLGR